MAALREFDQYVKKMAEMYNQRCAYLLKRLNEIGIARKAEPTVLFMLWLMLKNILPIHLKQKKAIKKQIDKFLIAF